MSEENKILCGSNGYIKKYFFNQEFQKIPEGVKKELQIMAVTFTESVGGILLLQFNPRGELGIVTQAEEDDILYDEIEAGIQVRKLQKEKEELFGALEMYYRIFFLGQTE